MVDVGEGDSKGCSLRACRGFDFCVFDKRGSVDERLDGCVELGRSQRTSHKRTMFGVDGIDLWSRAILNTLIVEAIVVGAIERAADGTVVVFTVSV